MFNVIAAGAMALSSLVSPVSAPAMAAPPPNKMVIDVASTNGSGCPNNSATVAVAPDNTAFTVTYSEYQAQVGVGTKPTDFRRNCQLILNVHVPQGYTYAIAKTDYRGYAKLAPGAWAYEQANYYFQGDSHTARARHNFAGPHDGDWQTTDVVGVESLVWARCGAMRFFNINTELRVGTGTSNPQTTTSLITMDSTDTELSTIFHLAWKAC
jgi:Domain of unknown function (DUF4360)